MHFHIPHINYSCWQTLISIVSSHFQERNKHTHQRTFLLSRFFPHKQKFKPTFNVYTYLESILASVAEVRAKGPIQECWLGIAVNIAFLYADFWSEPNCSRYSLYLGYPYSILMLTLTLKALAYGTKLKLLSLQQQYCCSFIIIISRANPWFFTPWQIELNYYALHWEELDYFFLDKQGILWEVTKELVRGKQTYVTFSLKITLQNMLN